jgi:hypothetical protein
MMGMSTANATTYEAPFIPQLNVILSQCYNLENNVREYGSVALLTAMPSVASLADALTYQDEVIRNVLVWGVAQLMALSDDDTVKAGFFGMRYAEEFNKASKFIPSPVTDFYGISEEGDS